MVVVLHSVAEPAVSLHRSFFNHRCSDDHFWGFPFTSTTPSSDVVGPRDPKLGRHLLTLGPDSTKRCTRQCGRLRYVSGCGLPCAHVWSRETVAPVAECCYSSVPGLIGPVRSSITSMHIISCQRIGEFGMHILQTTMTKVDDEGPQRSILHTAWRCVYLPGPDQRTDRS